MMDTTQPGETILKTGVLGRIKTLSERRGQLLDEFEQSGLSGKRYGESPQAFHRRNDLV